MPTDAPSVDRVLDRKTAAGLNGHITYKRGNDFFEVERLIDPLGVLTTDMGRIGTQFYEKIRHMVNMMSTMMTEADYAAKPFGIEDRFPALGPFLDVEGGKLKLHAKIALDIDSKHFTTGKKDFYENLAWAFESAGRGTGFSVE
jgi:hypothetical protein